MATALSPAELWKLWTRSTPEQYKNKFRNIKKAVETLVRSFQNKLQFPNQLFSTRIFD